MDFSSDLEAAIDAAPDVVDNYRVYGDWLEGRGDPRGPLIAMQIELESAVPIKQRELAKRIAEHIDRHSAELVGSLPREQLIWRWGFVRAAKLPLGGDADPAARVRDVLASPSARFLRELEINHAEHNQAIIDELVLRPPRTLRRLVAYLWSVPADFRALWPRIPRLEELAIGGENHVLGRLGLPDLRDARLPARTVDCLGELPGLRVLHLDSPLEESLVRALLARRDLPGLQSLNLRFCEFADAIAPDLSASPLVAQLDELDLCYGHLTDAGARAWTSGAPHPKLPILRIHGNRLTAQGRDLLAAVADRVIDRKPESW